MHSRDASLSASCRFTITRFVERTSDARNVLTFNLSKADYTSKWIHSFAEAVADGSPSTLDANSRWTEQLARRPSE